MSVAEWADTYGIPHWNIYIYIHTERYIYIYIDTHTHTHTHNVLNTWQCFGKMQVLLQK